MATARDVIKGSLRLIGAIAQGETPSADAASDALSALNDMLGDWSTQSLLIYAKVREEFSLIGSQQAYTMGPSANFNTTRPIKIEQALIKIVGSSLTTELPIEIVNLKQWSDIQVKATASSIPTKLYAEGTFPNETINLWPIPSAANTLVLYSWKPFTAFATLDTAVSLPPGYAKALRYGLALELAPEYGTEPSQLVALQAIESKESIKRMNIKPQLLEVDAAATDRNSAWNWMTGE